MGIKPVCVPTSVALASAAAQKILILISCSKRNYQLPTLSSANRPCQCVRACGEWDAGAAPELIACPCGAFDKGGVCDALGRAAAVAGW